MKPYISREDWIAELECDRMYLTVYPTRIFDAWTDPPSPLFSYLLPFFPQYKNITSALDGYCGCIAQVKCYPERRGQYLFDYAPELLLAITRDEQIVTPAQKIKPEDLIHYQKYQIHRWDYFHGSEEVKTLLKEYLRHKSKE